MILTNDDEEYNNDSDLRTSEAAVMALTLTMDGSQMKASKLSETSSERMSTPHQTLPWACLSGGSHVARRV